MKKHFQFSMKAVLVLGSFLLALNNTSAQITIVEKALKDSTSRADIGWKKGGVTTLNFSQMSFTNWVAGGQNSYALNGLISLFASYKRNSLLWDNTLDMGYGFIRQKDDVFPYKKTDDKFEFNSRAGYRAFSNFYYAGMLNFKTQFTEGFDYKNSTQGNLKKISNWLSPAYLTMAIGLNYQPHHYFSAFLAPLTERVTIVTNRQLRPIYSVDTLKVTRNEFGAYLRTVFSKNDFKMPFLKNITFTTKLDLFSNYLEKPQNIDVNWEVLIAMKVNKYLNININTQLIYDDDIKILDAKTGISSPKIQFKEILGIGVSYNF